MSNFEEWAEALDYRRRYRGLIGVAAKVPIRDRAVLSLVYTPGVAEACLAINEDPVASFDLTCRGNTVAILTDGSAHLRARRCPARGGHPDAGGQERHLQDLRRDRCLPDLPRHARRPGRSSTPALALAPTFGAICLDDISAPASFTIADHLEKAANIPVFSNQHHGTAILVLGGLYNALKVVGKRIEDVTSSSTARASPASASPAC